VAAGCPSRAASSRLELADIFRAHGDRLGPLSSVQAQAVRAITSCRTAALGGHVQECDRCGHREISYNSCRNRHCPKCQGLEKARWVEARRADVLPVQYHHVVFTVPQQLHPIFLANPKVAIDLLFRAVSDTLLEVAANPKRLGARIGFTAVLHTWTQTLLYHPHVHVIVSGGGLSPGGDRWISAKAGFFLPVRVLSKVFRGKLLSMLEAASGAVRLRQAPEEIAAIVGSSARKNWVVYSKPPVAGADQVLDYLGRYTHRIAISNERLVSLDDGRVTFRWKDRAHGNQEKLMTLEAEEFLRRFLLHVLPKRLVRIRHYGFLANAVRQKQIAKCRALLGTSADKLGDDAACTDRSESWQELLLRLTGRDVTRCPKCREGRLHETGIVDPMPIRRMFVGSGAAS
jgi:hypothetical protein